MKVKNMTSTSGNKVANQFIITDGVKVTFQSYDSEIVTIDYDNGTIFVGNNWDYSTTTGKYRNMFMHENYFYEMETKKGFQKVLDAGELVTSYRTFKIVKKWEV